MSGSYVVRALALVLAIGFTINSTHAQSGYAVVERGADYNVLQKTEVVNGTNRVHRYTELATGMNYTNSYGQLVPSSSQITLQSGGGAVATQGRHQVYFPANIYNGVIEVVTPDGKHLKSRPLGVSYDDGSNTVFIAELKSAVGYLTASNQVTYRDAFTGFKADLVCTCRRGGFECDLVFRQQPPTPGDYGLDETFSTLSMVTEFFNTQDPQATPAGYDDYFGLQDVTLKFGKLTMTHGKAFAFKANSQLPSANSSTPVYKSWVHAENRTFLVETVPVADIADNLDALPLTVASQKEEGRMQKWASASRQFPAAHAITACTNQILLAKADFKNEPGVVLDYNTVDTDQTDFTFQSGTYLVTGGCYLSGTTTFEGDSVIKFCDTLDTNVFNYSPSDGTGNGVLTLDVVNCQAGPEHPVVFTSMDDNSVGQVIPGSSGNPTTLGITYLNISYPYFNYNYSPSFQNLHFYYAGVAVVNSCFYMPKFDNCEFLNCNLAFGGYGGILTMRNCLLAGKIGIQNSEFGDTIILENVTFSNTVYNLELAEIDYGYLPDFANGYVTSMQVTNSLFAGSQSFSSVKELLTNLGGTIEDDANADVPNDAFQVGGYANYYLATSSPYRNAGTTNINPDLLAELKTMTTYAPQDGGMPDTNGTDLGYHYPVNEDSDHDGLPDWWEWKYFGGYNHTGAELDDFGSTFLLDYQNGRPPNMDSDHDGLPDWWELKYFNTINVNATNQDAYGNTLFADYQQGQDPNPIGFSIRPITYVNTSTPTLPLTILGGTPFYMAVLLNDYNTDDAVWVSYSSNLVASLNGGDGNYDVQVGLRGHAADSQQTWKSLSLVLDTVPPIITITNLSILTISNTVISLQGYANETLGSVSFDVSNGGGTVTNQAGYLTGTYYDNNLFAYTTNYFTCPNVNLADGSNTITIHAVDLAGNTTSLNLVLNGVADTSAPTLNVISPVAGQPISGSSFTVQAQVNHPAASITATIVDAAGNTNTVSGLVENNGQAWIKNLPLGAGNNTVTVTAVFAAGETNTQTFSVIGNDIGLVVNPLTQFNQSKVTVTGSVGDPDNDCVFVNGIKASYTNELGSWKAENVPVSASGTAVIKVEVYVGDPVLIGTETQFVPQPVTVATMSYQVQEHSERNSVIYWTYGTHHGSYKNDGLDDTVISWLAGAGGVTQSVGFDDNLPGTYDLQNSYGPNATNFPSYYSWENASVDVLSWSSVDKDGNPSWGSYQNQTATRVQLLAPGGQANGLTNVYLVRMAAVDASAYQGATPVGPLAPEAFQIGHQPLLNTGETNTSGAVWGVTSLSAPAGQDVDVTPSFITTPTGNWDYYYDVQAIHFLPPVADLNRDGQITLDGSDTATPEKPFRFWINDARESGDIIAGSNYQIPGQPAQLPNNEGLPYANYAYNQVQGRSDLVNFFPVALCLSNVMQWLPMTNGFQYRLSQADSAVKFIYTSLTNGNTFDYLTNTASTGYGTNFDKDANAADTIQVTNSQSARTILDTNWLAMVQTNGGNGIILLEGCAATTNALMLEVWGTNNTTHLLQLLGSVPMYLSITNVEAMFRHLNLRDGADAPVNLPGPPYSGDTGVASSMGEPANFPDSLTNNKWLVFTHGYNVSAQDSRGWEAEMFKRFYWSGSKSKFVGVDWLGNPMGTVRNGISDYYLAGMNAFATASVLASKLNALSGSKTIVGHSMGCELTAFALNDFGLQVNHACLMDAAFAQECFDDNADVNLTAMQPATWSGYPLSLFAANWFQRFDASDARSTLTWRNRFTNALSNSDVYSFYSSTEDVLGENNNDPTSIICDNAFAALGSFNSGPLGAYAWVVQEKTKGQIAKILDIAIQGSDYGGWGFNVCDGYLTNYPTWYAFDGTTGDRRVKTPDEIGSVTQAMLDGSRYNPLFKNGWGTWNDVCPSCINVNVDTSKYTGPSWIQGLFTTPGGSMLAAAPDKRMQLLAQAIPALSLPVGANPCQTRFLSGKQFDMPEQFADPTHWPSTDRGIDPITDLPRWFHSDLSQVAYPYIHKIFNQIVLISNQ